MSVSHMVAADVRIDLGGRYAGMTEHGLYAAQVRATGQQVGRK